MQCALKPMNKPSSYVWLCVAVATLRSHYIVHVCCFMRSVASANERALSNSANRREHFGEQTRVNIYARLFHEADKEGLNVYEIDYRDDKHFERSLIGNKVEFEKDFRISTKNHFLFQPNTSKPHTFVLK